MQQGELEALSSKHRRESAAKLVRRVSTVGMGHGMTPMIMMPPPPPPPIGFSGDGMIEEAIAIARRQSIARAEAAAAAAVLAAETK